jgi:hypothetical protein
MDQVKSWVTSKTVWLSIIGFVVQATQVLHVNLPLLDNPDLLAGQLANLVSAVLFLGAGLFRLTAKHKLV